MKLLLVLLLLVSCSKSPEVKSPILLKEDQDIFFEEISISTNSEGIIPDSEINFASLEYKQSASQTITITNRSVNSLNLIEQDFNKNMIAPFEIVSNTCIGNIEFRKKCYINIKLTNNEVLSVEQNLSSALIIKNSQISLTGILKNHLEESVINTSISINPSHLDFGIIDLGKSSELSVILKNNGSSSTSLNFSQLSSSALQLTSNTCPTPLQSRRTCTIKIKYSSDIENSVVNQELMKISNNSITYSAQSIAPTQESQEVLIKVEPIIKEISLSIIRPEILTNTVSFKNNGTASFIGPISYESSDPSIYVSSISCIAGLSRAKTCQISYSINSTLSPLNSSTQFLRLKSGNIVSDKFILNLQINEAQVGDVISFNPNYSEFNCLAQPCTTSGLATRSITSCQKLVNGEPVAGGVLSDCQSFNIASNLESSCVSPQGELIVDILNGVQTVSCLAGSSVQNPVPESIICDSGFSLNNGFCIADSITYQASYSQYSECPAQNPCDGMSTQERQIDSCDKYANGQFVETASINFCTPDAVLSQSCSSPSGNKSIDIMGGTKLVSCQEGMAEQNFVSITCENTYVAVGQTCQLQNQTRICQNQPINSIDGLESSSDGGQTWSSCSNFVCTSPNQIAQGSQCLNPPAGRPEVATVTPMIGGQVPTNATSSFDIIFDRDMDTSTFLNTNIYMNAGSVNLTVDLTNSTASSLRIIIPSGLVNNISYNIQVSSGIKDINGESLIPYFFNVYTGTPSIGFSPFKVTKKITQECVTANCSTVAVRTRLVSIDSELIIYNETGDGGTSDPVVQKRFALSKDGGRTFIDEMMPSEFDTHEFGSSTQKMFTKNGKISLVSYIPVPWPVEGISYISHYNGLVWSAIQFPQEFTKAFIYNISHHNDLIITTYTKIIDNLPRLYISQYNTTTNEWSSEIPVNYKPEVTQFGNLEVIDHGNGLFSLVYADLSNYNGWSGLSLTEYDANSNTVGISTELENVYEKAVYRFSVAQNNSGKALIIFPSHEINSQQLGESNVLLKMVRFNGINWMPTQTIQTKLFTGYTQASITNIAAAVSDNNSAIIAFAESDSNSGFAYRIPDISLTTNTVSPGSKVKITNFIENFTSYGVSYQIVADTGSTSFGFGPYSSETDYLPGIPRIAMSPSGEAVVTWISSGTSSLNMATSTRKMFNRYVPGVGWQTYARPIHFNPYLGYKENLFYSNGEFITSEFILSQRTDDWSVRSSISTLESVVGINRAVKIIRDNNATNDSDKMFTLSKTNPASGLNIGKGVRVVQDPGTEDYRAHIYLKSTDNWSLSSTIIIPASDVVDKPSIAYTENLRGDVAIAWRTSSNEIKMKKYFNTGTGSGTWSATRSVGFVTNLTNKFNIAVAMNEDGRVQVVYPDADTFVFNPGVDSFEAFANYLKGRTFHETTTVAVEASATTIFIAPPTPGIVLYDIKLISQNGRTVLIYDGDLPSRKIAEVNSSFSGILSFEDFMPTEPLFIADTTGSVGSYKTQVLLTPTRTAILFVKPKNDMLNNVSDELFLVYKDGSGAFSQPIRIDDTVANVGNYKAFIKNDNSVEVIYSNAKADPVGEFVSHTTGELRSRKFTNQLSEVEIIPKSFTPVNPLIWDADISSNGTLVVIWSNTFLDPNFGPTFYNDIFYNLKQPGTNWTDLKYFVQIPNYWPVFAPIYSLKIKIDNFGRLLGVFQHGGLGEGNPFIIYGKSIDY